MERVTPKALFDWYVSLPDESQKDFLRLLAQASTADVPLFMTAHLSDPEAVRFGDIIFAHAIDRLMPFLLSKAVELAQDNPGADDKELVRLLKESAEDFARDFASKAAEMERVKLKAERDRKSSPETIRRNVEICDLRKQDAKKWSYRRLARQFKMTPQAIGLVLKDEAKWRRLAASAK